jgi:P-type E1-E2 ATPase
MNKMAQLGCLVKGFAHVKTLGSVTDICTDKTGTFTTGRMAVVELCDLTNNYEFR